MVVAQYLIFGLNRVRGKTHAGAIDALRDIDLRCAKSILNRWFSSQIAEFQLGCVGSLVSPVIQCVV